MQLAFNCDSDLRTVVCHECILYMELQCIDAMVL